jgi:hypothetical protein
VSEHADVTVPEPRAGTAPHPIHLVVTDDLRRNRLTVFFRLLLAIPVVVWLGLWGIAAAFAVIAAWFAALVTGRVPDGLHRFLAAYVRYATRASAYALLAADPFPGFSSAVDYPVDVAIAGPERQNRLTVFFRGLLAIPATIVWTVLSNIAQLISVAVWFFALVTGRQSASLEEVQCYCLRYQAQTLGYSFLLTRRYPSFSDE